MRVLLLVSILVPFLLSGCGTYGKKTDVDVEIEYHITTTGPVYISPNFDQQSITGDIEDLKTDNRPDIPVDLQLTKPADILQSAIVDSVDNKIIDKAKKIKPDILKPEPIIPSTPSNVIYPKKFHHTIFGGKDGGVSFVTCPGQIRDYKKCSYAGVDMRRHGWKSDGTFDGSNRQGWWNMFKEPTEDTDVICVTKEGVEHHYPVDKKNVILRGKCN